MTRHSGEPTPSGVDPRTPDSAAAPTPDADSSVTPNVDPSATPSADPNAPHAATEPRRFTVPLNLSRTVTIWTVLVPFVAIFAGMMFSASSGVAQGTSLRSAAGGIADLIRDETRRGEIRAAEVGRLQADVDALTQARMDRDELVGSIVEITDRYAFDAGATPVQGPGLSVSLTDSPLRGDQIPPGLNVNDLVVHQQDVQAVVNALWRGGAEAMMIQDQRIISTSAVRCVGNTLILQGRVYSPPFVITAIGDQRQLQRALETDQTVQNYQDYVAVAGLGYAVELKDRIEAPAYAGAIRLQHATPVR